MRHGKKFNKLNRTSSHRKAMMANMAISLITHKRIKTTLPKAKALRKYVEPLITKAKNSYATDTSVAHATHLRRTVFSYLKDKYAVTELFNEVADRVQQRPGGYTRIIKLGTRLGDNAEMCLIELVDFNESYQKETKTTTKKSRRRRSKKKSDSSEEVQTEATEMVEEVQTEATEVVEESKDRSEE